MIYFYDGLCLSFITTALLQVYLYCRSVSGEKCTLTTTKSHLPLKTATFLTNPTGSISSAIICIITAIVLLFTSHFIKGTLSGDKACRRFISHSVLSFQYYSVHFSFCLLVCKRVTIFLTNGERGRKVKMAAGPGTSVYGRGLVESVSRSHWSHWNIGKTASHEP